MTEFTVDLNFIDQRLFSVLFLVGAFLGKGLDCVLFLVFVLYDQVDRCEISFSYFLDRLEQFMEAALVEFRLEKISPINKFFLVV